jgi:hypothetical protein
MYAYQKNPELKPAQAAATYAETMRHNLNTALAASRTTRGTESFPRPLSGDG